MLDSTFDRLQLYISMPWRVLFAIRYLGKVLVRQFLRRRLLVRRGLTNHEDMLAETIGTSPSGTTGDKQRDTRHPRK
jgi:hypothetical protein